MILIIGRALLCFKCTILQNSKNHEINNRRIVDYQANNFCTLSFVQLFLIFERKLALS